VSQKRIGIGIVQWLAASLHISAVMSQKRIDIGWHEVYMHLVVVALVKVTKAHFGSVTKAHWHWHCTVVGSIGGCHKSALV